MSRIGKKPIPIPPKVTITLDGNFVKAQGPKGSLERVLPANVTVRQEGETLLVERANDNRLAFQQQGLCRTLVANLIQGVTEGFTKPMQIAGVGYRLQSEAKKVVVIAGYSHPVEIEIPEGVSVEVEAKPAPIAGTRNQQGFNFVVKGIDKQQVGDLAAKIRAVRPPEPYKGKGIRYTSERILLKAGKSGKK